MSENIIDYVKYIEGHSDLGEQTIDVVLFALPSNLTVAYMDGKKPLFSVPWSNLSNIQTGYVEKRGLAGVGAFALRAIPGLNLLRAGDAHYDGIWVVFWDEDVQRSQSVYFAARSDRHARQVIQKILQYRDQYFRTVGKKSGPTTRKSGKTVHSKGPRGNA